MERKVREKPIYEKGALLTFFILSTGFLFGMFLYSIMGNGYALLIVCFGLSVLFSIAGIVFISCSKRFVPIPIIVLIYECINLPSLVYVIQSGFTTGDSLVILILFLTLIASFGLFIFGYAYEKYLLVSRGYFFMVLSVLIYIVLEIFTIIVYTKTPASLRVQGTIVASIGTAILSLFIVFGFISPIKAVRKLAKKKEFLENVSDVLHDEH